MNYLINKCLSSFLSLALMSTLFIRCSSEKQITSAYSQQDIAQAINNDRWDFTAEHAMPSYGRSRNLTGGYMVTLRKDTLVVSLPYYGKLNSPAGAMNGNPLDFRSTNFKMEKQEKKPGEWLLSIVRPDAEVQSMIFTFFDNGSAQANLIMTNRTGISFSGRVAPGK